jgi:hypothetical protein
LLLVVAAAGQVLAVAVVLVVTVLELASLFQHHLH